MGTDLWIEGVGFPPFSARGCVQELTPIPLSNEAFQRTVNGKLIYFGREEDMKYRTKIACQDKGAPSMGHMWRGSVMRVGCIQTLTHKIKEGAVGLMRPFIKDSVQVFDDEHVSMSFTFDDKNRVVSKGGYVTFRPILSMTLVDFSLNYDEWGGKMGWTLTLEEV